MTRATPGNACRQLPRRMLIGFGSLALGSCARPVPDFGRSIPPQSQTLIYEISSEPSGFDPATITGAGETTIMPALLENLVKPNLKTFEPEAALASHYKVNLSQTEFTFYLRGHPRPVGTKLPGAPAISGVARWSDGAPITAHDFVLAWRRCVDPANGSIDAVSFYPIAGAEEINAGKADPRTLGAYVVEDLTLRVVLHRPAAHFLKLIGGAAFSAVPSHRVEPSVRKGNGEPWTQPGRMVSSGAFVLKRWKPYEEVVVQRNPFYYDAGRVKLDRIVFLPVSDGATSVNLYRAGGAHATHGRAIPPLLIPGLRRRNDFRAFPALRMLCYAFNTTQPPFDDLQVRYAFNMATDKRELARFLGAGQVPATCAIPPIGNYQGLNSLPVRIGDHEYDVLAYNPEAARAILNAAKRRKLVLNLTVPQRPRSRELAQILQKQWSTQLGVETKLITMEWNAWTQSILSVDYTGVIESGIGSDYGDPNYFFEFFSGRWDGSGWSDSEFNRGIDRANAMADPPARMRALAECEERLLRAMPVLPLCFDVYTFLQKPFVRGQVGNSIDTPRFSEVWIDTNWRPS